MTDYNPASDLAVVRDGIESTELSMNIWIPGKEELDRISAHLEAMEARIKELEGKLDKRIEREDQLNEHTLAFWQKYGLGSKLPSSCFQCGKIGSRAITHLELPDIYICQECSSLRAQLTAEQEAHEKLKTQANDAAVLWQKAGDTLRTQLSHSEAARTASEGALKLHSSQMVGNLKGIQKSIEGGHYADAHSHIDDLLELMESARAKGQAGEGAE